MHHSPADVIRYLLIQLGLGTDPGDNTDWPIYAPSEPDKPDNAITVYTTAPDLHGRAMPTKEILQHFGVLIRVRSTTDPELATKAYAIANTVARSAYFSDIMVDTHVYRVANMTLRSGPLFLGRPDEDERLISTLNYVVPIRLLS